MSVNYIGVVLAWALNLTALNVSVGAVLRSVGIKFVLQSWGKVTASVTAITVLLKLPNKCNEILI